MLRPIAFSVALESLLPRVRVPHRPAPAVWEDRVHARRSVGELLDVTARLTRHTTGADFREAVCVQTELQETETAAMHTGVIAALAVRTG